MPRRMPGAVVIARVLAFVHTGLFLVGGIALLAVSGDTARLNEVRGSVDVATLRNALVVIGVISLVVAALLGWLAVLLTRPSNAARIGLIVLEGALALLSIPSLVRGGGATAVNLAIAAAIVLLLNGSAARAVFQAPRHPGGPPGGQPPSWPPPGGPSGPPPATGYRGPLPGWTGPVPQAPPQPPSPAPQPEAPDTGPQARPPDTGEAPPG